MATKQELEAQVLVLQAEVEALKVANPDAAKLQETTLRADTAEALLKSQADTITDLVAEAKKQAVLLITSEGEAQSLLEKLKEKNDELEATGKLLDGAVANLAAATRRAGNALTKVDPTVQNVRDLKEKMRRGECRDDQRVVLSQD